jgi:hypothetical protein
MHINSIQKVFLVVGTLLLLIAMFANVNLYVSLASTLVDKATWALMGLLFDVLKIMSLIVCGVLFTFYNRPFAALLAFLFWLVLTGVSLFSLFGYTSLVTQESERQAALNSMGYKSAQSSLENSETRLAAMAGVAAIDAGALQAKFDALTQRKASVEAELAACPRNYITKCLNPANAKLEAIQRELAPIATQLGQVHEYRGLQAAKAGAIESTRTALAGGASEDVLHPMFVNGAIVLNDLFHFKCNGNQLKIWFLALSAVLCELLASYALFLVSVFGGRNLHGVQGLQGQPHGIGVSHTEHGHGLGAPAEALAVPK